MAARKRTVCDGIKAVNRRHALLLEVLIAFVLVVMCVLPMIYPQVYILRSEKRFIDAVELDHTVNLVYANRLQKMYLNEIGWSDIEGEKSAPVSEEILREAGFTGEFPYDGEYKFLIVKRKPPSPEDRLYLINLIFTFTPKNISISQSKDIQTKPEQLEYSYSIFVERRPKQVKDGESKEEKADSDQSKGAKS